jgi:WD40 repeat protein
MVVAWADSGTGARRELPAGTNSITTLAPLPNDGMLVAAMDPYLAVLDPDRGTRWAQTPQMADFRSQEDSLAVAADGQTIGFGYVAGTGASASFDVTTRVLRHDLPEDDKTAPPEHEGLPIQDWEDTFDPTLDGAPLLLEDNENSRSLAIDPDGERFVLGTEWYLRAYGAQGEELWRETPPGTAWAVNISGDGRLVVAAYGDGTIRWHRMDDGKELLAFFPLVDRTNWVAWTPDGFYAATPGAHGVLRWHVNRGWDEPADSIAIADIPGSFRPAVLPLVLEMDIAQALGLVEVAEYRRQVAIRTNSRVPPGAGLHLLTIGISS